MEKQDEIFSFPYRGETMVGRAVKYNRKTVTIETKVAIFRVPYSLLTPKIYPPNKVSKKRETEKGILLATRWSKNESLDYKKSQSAEIEPISRHKSEYLSNIVKHLSYSLKKGDEKDINEFTNLLISELNKLYALPQLKVFTGGKRKLTRSGGQYYGVYRTRGTEMKKSSISVYSRTAKTKKFVAPKTFLRTLIHEWAHHFDKYKLGLTYTYHTKGFYRRANKIYNQLKLAID